MPLSKLQGEILRTLAAQRNPESYIAGSTPLHRDGPRFSGDIDIFHHREERAAAGRQAPRDALDLLYIHEQHLPLGAVIWAKIGCSCRRSLRTFMIVCVRLVTKSVPSFLFATRYSEALNVVRSSSGTGGAPRSVPFGMSKLS